MGRLAKLSAIGLFAAGAAILAGCGSGEEPPRTKEALMEQLNKTVDYDKLPADQKAKLPNPGDGRPSGPPPQFAGDRTQ